MFMANTLKEGDSTPAGVVCPSTAAFLQICDAAGINPGLCKSNGCHPSTGWHPFFIVA